MSKFGEHIQLFYSPEIGVVEMSFVELRDFIKAEIARCYTRNVPSAKSLKTEIILKESLNGATSFAELIFHYEEYQTKVKIAKKIYFGKTYQKAEK